MSDMTSQSTEGGNSQDRDPITSTHTDDGSDPPPLWKYVTKLEKVGTDGGTWKFKCNQCNLVRTSSYWRVRAHLLQNKGCGIQICTNMTPSLRLEMKKEDDEYERRKANSGPREVPLPSESHLVTDSSFKKRKLDSNPIARAFGVHARDQLDQEIARMFYTGGLPFNLARNPHYMRSYTFAATHDIGGYKPPGYNKLRTTLLAREKNHVENLLVPLKSAWKERGVTIVSDGWSDPTRKPLINFMATSGNGPMFLKAVNCFGETKDKSYIANLMKEVIQEVGVLNVVQVITDNAANCKEAGEIIELEFPHIYWTPCVVHTLNLALKDICAAKNTTNNAITYDECSWIAEVHGDAVQIKNFIMNHNLRLAIFEKFSSLKLLSVAETRFASVIVMLKRFKLIKRSLQAMVISEEWTKLKEDDTGKASFVKEKIVSDDWWDMLDYIVDFSRPIYEMIRFCDTDKPSLHLVYEMWDSTIEKVKIAIYKKEGRPLSESSSFYEVVSQILIVRWTKSNTALQCLAHSLNPKFYSDEWLAEDSNRVAPHTDGDISDGRMNCFERLFGLGDQLDQVMNEYAQFSMRSGPFEDLMCMSKMCSMDPKHWWANFGAKTPLLQSLAFKLLGQPTSSSCCERNWSTYSFIHSLRRNKLNPSRAQDLVYIHNNLRLLSRNSEEKDDSTKMWDLGGDAFDSMEDAGFLEVAELSLDEPDFENDLLARN